MILLVSSFLGLAMAGKFDEEKDSIIIILLTPASIIDPFCAWKPPLCQKDTAKGCKLCIYGIKELA